MRKKKKWWKNERKRKKERTESERERELNQKEREREQLTKKVPSHGETNGFEEC